MSFYIHTEADLDKALARLLAADPRLGELLAIAGRPPLRRRPDGFAGLASIMIAVVFPLPDCPATMNNFSWRSIAAVNSRDNAAVPSNLTGMSDAATNQLGGNPLKNCLAK